ncbi:MAG: hypothetical protein NTY69_04575 [Methylococcales bacterium]|nr:hypothetical protein [Methylococcales bacterium]
MTIKKRGLGRGLEALLVNVSSMEETPEQSLNNNVQDNSAVSAHDPLNHDSTSYTQLKTANLVAEPTIDKNITTTLAYQQANETVKIQVTSLLQEAESLRSLLIEFEDILLNR